MSEENNQTSSDNTKKALCYIPFVSVFIFFTETNKDKSLKKHINYGIFLLLGFIFCRFLLVGILHLPLGGLLFLIYIGISGYFGYKAYSGEEFNIEQIDKIEQEINKKL